MNKALFMKILKIAGNVLTYAFMAVCLALVIFSFSFKKTSDDALTIFGMQARIIQSDSMEKSEFTNVSKYDIKSIPVKSLVFIQTVPEDEKDAEKWFNSLKVGDVLTFRYVYNGQVTITHRIVKIEDKKEPSGGRIITLEGDNKTATNNLMQQTLDTSRHFDPTCYNYIIGKVTGQSHFLGLALYAVNTPVGMFCIVVLPCLIIIIMEIVRIVSVFSEEKRKKAEAEKEQKDAEIELLKQQLAAALQDKNEAPQQESIEKGVD